MSVHGRSFTRSFGTRKFDVDEEISEMMNRYGIDSQDSKRTFTFSEMRLLAKSVLDHQRQYRQLKHARIIGFIFLVLLFVVAVIAAAGAYSFTKTTSVKAKGEGGQATLIQKSGKRVVSTAESAEDMDVSMLIDYNRDEKDSNGDPDGEWLLPDARLGMVRSLIWQEEGQTHIQRVSQISRINGKDAHVMIVTKAGHEMRIWDSDGTDNFNVEIRRRDPETGTFSDWTEVLPEGDDDERGSGRVLVSMRRPSTRNDAKEVALADYDLD